jgi:hypothetical protein
MGELGDRCYKPRVMIKEASSIDAKGAAGGSAAVHQCPRCSMAVALLGEWMGYETGVLKIGTELDTSYLMTHLLNKSELDHGGPRDN